MKQAIEDLLDVAAGAAAAKENDFDLDFDAALWKGKKGQAGTRTRSQPS